MASYSNSTGARYDNFRSFLIAVALYLSIILIFLYEISELRNNPKKYTDDLNAYTDVVTLDIDDSPVPTAPNLANENQDGDTHKQDEKPVEEEKLKTTTEITTPLSAPKKPESAKEERQAEPKKEEPNLNDLFYNTTTDNKKLSDSTSKTDAVQSSKKSDKTTQTKAAKQAKSKNAVAKSNVVTGRTQLTGEYDAYRGKIDKILKRLWNKYSAIGKDDSTVVITFDGNGKVTNYEIKRLGINTSFNQKLRDFLGNLKMQTFPKSPDGKPFVYEVNLDDVLKTNF